MRTLLDPPKVVDGESVPKQAEALQAPPLYKLKQRMKYGGAEYTTALHLKFGCVTANHDHLR